MLSDAQLQARGASAKGESCPQRLHSMPVSTPRFLLRRSLSVALIAATSSAIAGALGVLAAVAAVAADAPDQSASEPPTVTVELRDGTILVGGLVEKSDDKVVIRLTSTRNGHRMSADRTLSPGDITSLRDVHSDYSARAAACAATGPAHAELAVWCLSNQLISEGKTEAHTALKLEAVNASAATTLHRLGEVRIDDAWTDLNLWLAKKGLVQFDGTVCDEATRAKLRVLIAARLGDAQALSDALAAQAHQVTVIKDGNAKIVKLQGQRAALVSAQQDAAKLNAAVDAAKRAVDAAGQRVAAAEKNAEARRNNSNGNNNGNNGNNGGLSRSVLDAQDAQHKAQQDLKTAQYAAQAADPTTAKKRLDDLDKDTQSTTADVKKATDGQAQVDAAVAAAKTKADASAAAYSAARQQVQPPADLPPDVLVALADLSAK